MPVLTCGGVSRVVVGWWFRQHPFRRTTALFGGGDAAELTGVVGALRRIQHALLSAADTLAAER